jgi:hypothetical protein
VADKEKESDEGEGRPASLSSSVSDSDVGTVGHSLEAFFQARCDGLVEIESLLVAVHRVSHGEMRRGFKQDAQVEAEAESSSRSAAALLGIM